MSVVVERSRPDAETLAGVVFNNRIHVFLMPVAFTLFWNVGLRLPLPWTYYVMIVLHTAAAYLINMVTDAEEDAINYPTKGRVVGPAFPWIRALIVLCFCGSFLLALAAGWGFVVYGSILNFLGYLYGQRVRFSTPFFSVNVRIKESPWLKNAYSASFWSVALLVTPFLYLHVRLDWRLWFVIPEAFLLAFIVELLWDVRDVRGDAVAGVRTIPLCLGEGWTRGILHTATVLSGVVAWSGFHAGVLPVAYFVIVPHCLVTAAFIEWYFRYHDRQIASHVYLVYCAVMMLVALGVDRWDSARVVASLSSS